MFTYKKTKTDNVIEVYGWEESTGDDDVFFGYLFLCDEGYWWFKPARYLKMSCKMLKTLSIKLSDMNKGE